MNLARLHCLGLVLLPACGDGSGATAGATSSSTVGTTAAESSGTTSPGMPTTAPTSGASEAMTSSVTTGPDATSTTADPTSTTTSDPSSSSTSTTNSTTGEPVDPNGCVTSIDGWCWTHPLPHGNRLHDIWDDGQGRVWVAGEGGTLMYHDGQQWTTLPASTPTACAGSGAPRPTISGQSAISARSYITTATSGQWSRAARRSGSTPCTGSPRMTFWAVGGPATVLHWDGVAWSPVAAEIGGDQLSLWGSGANDVWIGGSGFGGPVAHWDGKVWTFRSVDGAGSVTALWGSGPQDILRRARPGGHILRPLDRQSVVGSRSIRRSAPRSMRSSATVTGSMPAGAGRCSSSRAAHTAKIRTSCGPRRATWRRSATTSSPSASAGQSPVARTANRRSSTATPANIACLSGQSPATGPTRYLGQLRADRPLGRRSWTFVDIGQGAQAFQDMSAADGAIWGLTGNGDHWLWRCVDGVWTEQTKLINWGAWEVWAQTTQRVDRHRLCQCQHRPLGRQVDDELEPRHHRHRRHPRPRARRHLGRRHERDPLSLGRRRLDQGPRHGQRQGHQSGVGSRPERRVDRWHLPDHRLSLDGVTWTSHATSKWGAADLWGTGPNDLFAVSGANTSPGIIYHWDGVAWAEQISSRATASPQSGASTRTCG